MKRFRRLFFAFLLVLWIPVEIFNTKILKNYPSKIGAKILFTYLRS